MATTSRTLVANMRGGPCDLKAKLATRAVVLGCVAALALGGLRTGDVAGASPRALTQPQPAMLAVDEHRCVYANPEGVPGEGCGPGRYILLPVSAAAADASNCVSASVEAIPGEVCGPAPSSAGDSRP